MEAEYVNGVYNANGELVMRPLTKEETEWLSQFYAETEHGEFAKTAEIEEAQKKYNETNSRLRHAKKLGLGTEEVLNLKQESEALYKKLVHLRSETNTFYPEDEDRHEIFNTGYKRREDVFNVAKATNRLVKFDLPEFDKFVSEGEKSINPENLALDYMTRKPARKVIKRKRGVKS